MATEHARAKLLLAASDGDPRAMERLLDGAVPLVLGWCKRRCGPRLDPEDAAQDILERALSRLHTLEDPDRFEAWLYGITRRRLADLRRLAWVQRWVPGSPVAISGPRSDPEYLAGLSETARRVQDVLERLPAIEREVLVLYHVEGRSSPEIAALLGVPVGTVKSRMRRARGRFGAAARREGLIPGLVEL